MRFMKPRLRLSIVLGFVLGVALALTGAQAQSPAPASASAGAGGSAKKILFLSGPKDHGRPGRHEYEKDLRVLAKSLEESPNLKGIETKVFVGQAPREPFARARRSRVRQPRHEDAHALHHAAEAVSGEHEPHLLHAASGVQPADPLHAWCGEFLHVPAAAYQPAARPGRPSPSLRARRSVSRPTYARRQRFMR